MARLNTNRIFDWCYYGSVYPITDFNFSKALVIPSTQDVFEVPASVMRYFTDCYANTKNQQFPEAILYFHKTSDNSAGSYYKSLEANFKDVIYNDVFCKIKVGEDRFYYVGKGMVLNSGMSPLMMCSWEIKRTIEEDNSIKFHILHPVLRIDPYCFIHRDDQMLRFITGKFLSTSLETQYYCGRNFRNIITEGTSTYCNLKVVIEKCPYEMLDPMVPDIKTNTEDLLKGVLDHIDSVML